MVSVEDGAVGGTVRVLLDRPPVNAFDLAQYGRLADVVAQLAADTPRCILLGSAIPGYFSAGRDLREPAPAGADALQHRHDIVTRLYRSLLALPCPVVGVIDGYALGAGLVLASLCDVRVASHRTEIGLPEVKAGSVGGARLLMRALPAATVRWLALSGAHLPVERARELGFLERTVAPEDLWAAADEISAAFAALRPDALALVKRTYDTAAELPMWSGVAAELAAGSLTTAARRPPHADRPRQVER